ncbi:MAG: response regulator [Chloroflexota bacterium]
MSEKILIVDDDLQMLKLVGLVLDRSGYQIAVARSGQQALEKVRTEQPDLVILDIALPDMDGYEVTRRLRAEPDTADLPIIHFTARTQVQDRLDGFEVGADDYVTKPVHPEELVSRVQALLIRSSRRQTSQEAHQADVIGLVGSKGGVGTTALAVNLALALVTGLAEDKRVVLAEFRSGMATAALQLGFPRRGRITEVLAQPAADVDADLIAGRLDLHETGLLVLTGQSEPFGVARALSADHAEVMVQHLGVLSDYVLLDLGVGLEEVNRTVLPLCRRVVVTIEPNDLSLTLAKELLEEMNRSLNVPAHRISLVMINRSRSAASFNKTTIEEKLAHDLTGVIPAAPELSFQATKDSRPIVIAAPDSFVAQQYAVVAAALLDRL